MKKNNLIKIVLTGIVIFLLLYIVYANFNLRNEINLSNESKNYLAYRLSLLDREKEIQKENIANKVALDGIINDMDSPTPILMFLYNPLANQKSLFDALKYYQYLFKNKKLGSKVKLVVIIPTKSLSYIKALSIQYSKEIEFYPDTSLKFFKKIELNSNDNAVFLLTKSLRCAYCYLLEIDNPLKDIWESDIIIRYINLYSLK